MIQDSVQIFAQKALIQEGWCEDVRVVVDQGMIVEVVPGSGGGGEYYQVPVLVPALSNLHSHTFQRAMAGMTEYRSLRSNDPTEDNFWSWRNLMYRFLDVLNPDDVEAVAAQSFVEMQESGFAAVAEFHYLHHQAAGVGYHDPAELSLRVCEAARDVGIGLTHLPVLYSYGGVDRGELVGGQLRFKTSVDQFAAIHARVERFVDNCCYRDYAVGIAPHSLRAVSLDQLVELTRLYPHSVKHIHVAEQVKEVEEVRGKYGVPPVGVLLDTVDLDQSWCLIHATYLEDFELQGIAKHHAVVGYCPVTECNLGDGIARVGEYLALGGLFGVGTDSNVLISAALELRSLEYSQRLRDRARNVLATATDSTGLRLYRGALRGGSLALGRDSGEIAVGKIADLVALKQDHPTMCGLDDNQLLDGWIFGTNSGVVSDLWSAGRHCVIGGVHKERERVFHRYKKVLTSLVQRGR